MDYRIFIGVWCGFLAELMFILGAVTGRLE